MAEKVKGREKRKRRGEWESWEGGRQQTGKERKGEKRMEALALQSGILAISANPDNNRNYKNSLNVYFFSVR